MKTFEELCPEWAKKFAKGEIATLQCAIDMESYPCCAVGEAHGLRGIPKGVDTPDAAYYKGEGGCDVCEKFALDFMYAYLGQGYRANDYTEDPEEARNEDLQLFEPEPIYDIEKLEQLKKDFTAHFNAEHLK